jgi:hypothetical protein
MNENEIDLYVPSGYKLVAYYCRTKSSHGGSAIYVSTDISYDVDVIDIKDAGIEGSFEVSGIEITNYQIIIFSVYRSPNYSVNIFWIV